MITAYIALMAESLNLEGGNFFVFFAVLMAVFAVIFGLIAKGYVMQDYMEPGDVIVDPALVED